MTITRTVHQTKTPLSSSGAMLWGVWILEAMMTFFRKPHVMLALALLFSYVMSSKFGRACRGMHPQAHLIFSSNPN